MDITTTETESGPVLCLTTGTTIRELIRAMAESKLDVVACDLPEMKFPGVLLVALMPTELADQVRPVLMREFERFYENVPAQPEES